MLSLRSEKGSLSSFIRLRPFPKYISASLPFRRSFFFFLQLEMLYLFSKLKIVETIVAEGVEVTLLF